MSETPEQAAPEAAQQQVQIMTDTSKATESYTNFCRVIGTPEELVVDFGLNTQPNRIPTEPIVISQRVIMNFYTAKRLLIALQQTVMHHEAVFGVLETDFRRRIQPQAQQPQQ